ncbi:lipoprotein LpqH [Mycolicibacterium sp.]|uniref:lipoprotein LpqH n=1 Tax=Mycolicibacterium sp. TaxID=2320850 RepID=UPI0025F4156D|nr:lipoprotein LpqH [Mycolicibacterium sp.]
MTSADGSSSSAPSRPTGATGSVTYNGRPLATDAPTGCAAPDPRFPDMPGDYTIAVGQGADATTVVLKADSLAVTTLSLVVDGTERGWAVEPRQGDAGTATKNGNHYVVDGTVGGVAFHIDATCP